MSFVSLHFILFLPIVFTIYWVLPKKWQWLCILVVSYYFYMSWNAKYVILIFLTTFVSWLCAIGIEKTESKYIKNGIIWFCLLICLGILFLFKYFNFTMGAIDWIFERLSLPLHETTLQLLLPVGISFYTFQTIGYVIDVYRGNISIEKNFGKYAAFVSFFPQLVAGPIERSKNLLYQIKEEHTFKYEEGVLGLRQMLWGYFKKIAVADTLAVYADKVFDNVSGYNGGVLLLATFFFTLQIYCDFSGYSDIAIGTARLFGVRLMTNFSSPYFSTSIREFWSRWHISLSTWFRDYVYIPLGGNRKGKIRRNVNTMLTFLLSGLWHGANITFVLWGVVHGFGQVIENIIGVKPPKSKSTAYFIRIMLVFTFCLVAWVLFRADSVSDAIYVYTNMLNGITNPVMYIINALSDIGIDLKSLLFICVTITMLIVMDVIEYSEGLNSWIDRLPKIVRIGTYYGEVVICIIAYIYNMGSSQFVYFQF